MSLFILPGFWKKLTSTHKNRLNNTKGWLNLDEYIDEKITKFGVDNNSTIIHDATIHITPIQLQNSVTTPVTLISAPTNPNQAIEVLSASFKIAGGTVAYDFQPDTVSFISASSYLTNDTVESFTIKTGLYGIGAPNFISGYLRHNADQALIGVASKSIVAGDSIIFQTQDVYNATQGDSELTLFLTYRYINFN